MDIGELTRQLARRREEGSGDGLSGRVVSDSRKVGRGDVFVAIRGTRVDGHDYIGEVARRGAGVIVREEKCRKPNAECRSEEGENRAAVREVVVPDSTAALAELAQASYGYPRDQLKALGVTGTKGKTTTAYLVRWILNQARIGCGMIGTVEYDLGGGRMLPSNNTTPDSLQLAEMMGQMRQAGLSAMMMECSSHGLDQRRTAGLRFTAAAFTNLTGDHLDYHGDRDNYLAAKSRLFRELESGTTAILNRHDAASEYLAGVTKADIIWYGIDTPGEILGRIRRIDLSGTVFELEAFGGRAEVRTRLAGVFNVSNCLAAAGLARTAGANFEQITAGIESFPGVPGRLERVEAGQDFTVLVDYAHTDDALMQVLSMLGELKPRRVIVVFGCGGDRDRTKRPRMAAAAQRLADVVVVTNDNPRTEDPQRIFEDIRKGFTTARAGTEIREIADRAEAIGWAIGQAGAGDVVLIAGKGHEDYQIIGEKKIHFDDREAAKEKLEMKNQISKRNKSVIAEER